MEKGYEAYGERVMKLMGKGLWSLWEKGYEACGKGGYEAYGKRVMKLMGKGLWSLWEKGCEAYGKKNIKKVKKEEVVPVHTTKTYRWECR